MLTRRCFSWLVLLAAAGCSAFEPRAGFDQVSKLVTDRVGAEAVWLTGGEEDQRVRDGVAELLAEPLTVDDVTRVVLLNNLELQATYEELDVAQADVVQAGLLTNPTLGLERRFSGGALEADVALGFLDVFLIPLRKRVAGPPSRRRSFASRARR